ncbi:MAG TPA: hypothetical protein VN649_10410 [Ramlibacter sp.]|nr:hypothetical protein [Ramlibacter sp.]
MHPRALALVALLSLGLAGCNRPVEGNAPPPGTTGSGTSDGAGRGPAATTGTGLSGGMSGTSGLGMTGTFPSGTATQSSGAGPAPEGGPNRTPRSGVGTR